MQHRGNGKVVTTAQRAGRAAGRPRPGANPRERGVASVLSMMFLIMFGSLATAMAIASRGNIRTAASHLHISRAQSAAETGLAIAASRLASSASRFVVSNSNINASFGRELWGGPVGSATGTCTVLAPTSGFSESGTPDCVSEAILNMHAADQAVVRGVTVDAPVIANAMAGAPAEYASTGWVYTPAVAVEGSAQGQSVNPLCFSVTYAPLANGTDVRVIATGYDFNYERGGAPISRTVMLDFRFAKRVNQAVMSPTRIQIGKNVLVTGDLGARFTDVSRQNGDPLTLRSDFLSVDTAMDPKVTDLLAALAAADVDKDNRLRVGHPTEGAGIPMDRDYNGDGTADSAFADATNDGYVDELDVFINHYDRNHDGRVVLSSALIAGTPAQNLSPEFVSGGGQAIDDDLALAIDSSNPDRNRNGVYGWLDSDRDGLWESGETMLDPGDQVLGWRDGVVDKRDQYAKVRGRVVMRTTEGAWTAAQGSYADAVRGPIVPGQGQSPMNFGATTDELPDLTAASFADSNTALIAAADGQPFNNQVADQLGIPVSQLPTYVESESAGTSSPRYLRVDSDANLDGKPDNWQTAYWEKMPFNSPSYSDCYYRPVYENMVFRDAKIPVGNNGLFRNCTFVGVTHVQSTAGNSHVLWSEYGKMVIESSSGRPGPSVTRYIYGDNSGETNYPTMLPSTATPPNQMILMGVPEMDKADVPSNETGRPGYASLPEPLVIGGRRVTDTKLFSNNLRFHDCLFVGSIVSDNPGEYTQARNKMQFTGATRFVNQHPDAPDDNALNPQDQDLEEIAKSSMMLPNYSVDIGSFNSPQTQDVQLKGAVVAGVMDIRGNAAIDGALLLTFSPVFGQGPLRDAQGAGVGNPANFNTTIGYFGPSDGDSESLDPNTLPVYNGVRYVGWDLDGDGLADLGPTQSPTQAQIDAGATRVPFSGYGRISLRFNGAMNLPNGIMLPVRADPIAASYKEGNPCR